MIKNKGIIYTIGISLVLVVGLAFITSKQNTGYNMASEAETNRLGAEATEGKIAFNKFVGEVAPDFSLENINGETITLNDYQGKMVVLFFNEGSMCYPACWNQIQQFTTDERFNKDDIEVFSIVIDTKRQWEKIVSETSGFENAQILFDTSKTVSNSYDVLTRGSSMHPGTNPGHTYIVIDKEGVIRYVYDDPSMAVRNDVIFYELSKLIGE